MTQQTRSTILIAIGASIISLSAVFVKLAAVPADAAGFYRVFFGACILFLFVIVRREKIYHGPRSLLYTAGAAAFFFLDLACWHRSIGYLGPGLGTLFPSFQVFFVSLAGFLFLQEKISFRFALALPVALTGIVLIVNPLTFTIRSDFGTGVALGFAVSFFYAGYILLLRRAKRKVAGMSAFSTMFLTSAFCALFFFAETAVSGISLYLPGPREVLLLAAYGILGQGIAWVLITENMPHVKASRTGLLLLLQPALSYVWDIMFFNRAIQFAESAGVILALTAIYLGTSSRNE